MKILLATAKVDEIRWAATSGLVDGVLTTPPLLRHENRNERELLADMSAQEREQLLALLRRIGLRLGLQPGVHAATQDGDGAGGECAPPGAQQGADPGDGG